jgi:predicted Zn finger-like uncharacterized protein
MMLTRCSYCGTMFRISPEQLRMRNGQVRCGHCDAVFNALDLLEEGHDVAALIDRNNKPMPSIPVPTLSAAPQNQSLPKSALTSLSYDSTTQRSKEPSISPEIADYAGGWRSSPNPSLTDFSGDDDDDLDRLISDDEPSATWPYALAALCCFMLLGSQLLYTYRTPLASNSAFFATVFQSLKVNVPLPRITDLVLIESTDLQADKPKNQLLLTATLRNRANHNQDWPALELTLTDTTNGIISRRVLNPPEYLPTEAPPALAARADLGIKLWLSSENLNAAGYRLYVFYP